MKLSTPAGKLTVNHPKLPRPPLVLPLPTPKLVMVERKKK
jgi:hypothetical protein